MKRSSGGISFSIADMLMCIITPFLFMWSLLVRMKGYYKRRFNR